MLSCRQVAVRFGGLQALDRVDLETRKGEIVGLIGPNGAGKTTLMECISGFQPVAGGGITYLRPDTGAEEDLLRRLSGERAGMGIGRTLQNVRLFPYLTVLDNSEVVTKFAMLELRRDCGDQPLTHTFKVGRDFLISQYGQLTFGFRGCLAAESYIILGRIFVAVIADFGLGY